MKFQARVARRRRRTGPPAFPWVAVLCMMLAAVGVLRPVTAVFTDATAAASTFTADVLSAPGSFTASRPCTASGGGGGSAAYRDGEQATVASASSVTVPTPTSVAGDMFVAIVKTVSVSASTPSGWSNLTTGSSSGISVKFMYMARPATPAASYTFSWSGAQAATAILLSYSGVSAVGSGSTLASSGTSMAAPGKTIATAPATFLVVYAAAVATISSSPAGMTARDSYEASGLGIHVFDEPRPSTGATGTRTATLPSSVSFVAASLVLTGGGGGGTVDPTITLDWTATPDTYATGYEIIRASGPTTAISGRTTVTWSDTTTTDTTAYTYTITSVIGNWRSATQTVAVPAC